ncbi:30S ribosome-binding factor RbfA [Mesonia sp. HuA40]|jgi:ribosome-binding factor A|uniref:30S ribosome-binding factor RbfA n=1 Tax=Mesonia sp. HuA40 TaxID=2602761 RepID=UPI0011CB002C|nr:30S ribosome-binding factor RbfA [Mesonia sp. HuA40]TXK72611.1 30S ribosome-binding factor RbfA [Mesonia sp. HuA40]
MEETNRQKKIAGVLQEDLARILQQELKNAGITHIIISVSKVRVTTDLSLAKAYLSIFPTKDAAGLLAELNQIKPKIKHQMAQLTKNQLRKMPDLAFYLDDSLDYIENIDKAVNEKENPIENRDLLDRRKKS